MDLIVVLGSGPHGREVADIAEACGHMAIMLDDNDEVKNIDGHTDLYKEMGWPYVLGPAWPKIRRRMWVRMPTGKQSETLIHPDTTISKTVRVSPGVVLAAGVRITTGSTIGSHSHMGINSGLSHSCTVGNCVTICPGVSISGEVYIGDDVFLGVGSTVMNGVRIGKGSIVGAGAVVIRDVLPNTVVVGNPARYLRPAS